MYVFTYVFMYVNGSLHLRLFLTLPPGLPGGGRTPAITGRMD